LEYKSELSNLSNSNVDLCESRKRKEKEEKRKKEKAKKKKEGIYGGREGEDKSADDILCK
tara:strand:- start:412 stop:591 length:180 start_codon:yes stop_codon:yes gene_type:complete